MAKLTRKQVEQAIAAGGSLLQADLSGLDLSGICFVSVGGLVETNLQGCNLQKVDLSGVSLTRANMQECDLRGAVLDHAFMRRVNLRGADLRHSKMLCTDLQEANLQDTDLRNTNLTVSSGLDTVNFQGAKYNWQTKWPKWLDLSTKGTKKIW